MLKASYNRQALKPETRVAERYQIEKLLGQGGFAFTYLATDLRLRRRVAVKELFYHKSVTRQGKLVVLNVPEEHDDWQWALGKFKHEAQHLAKLRRHPNIVSVNDLIEENGTAYIVMNYVDGRSLGERLRELGHPLSAAELRPIFLQILRGLEAVHGAQLLHRDIKPDNIYLTDADQIILLDFGAARPDERPTSRLSSRVPYSDGYSPPEQYRLLKPTPASDLYSVAATMVRAITGETPPRATEREQKDHYLPVAVRCAGRYPAEFLRTVDAAMSLDPKRRPASVEAWRRMLKNGLPPLSEPTPLPPTPKGPRTNLRRAVLLALLVGVVILALAALGVLLKSVASRLATDRTSPPTADSELQAVLARMAREQRATALPPAPSTVGASPAESPVPLAAPSPTPALVRAEPSPTDLSPGGARSAAATASPSPSAPTTATPGTALATALVELAKTELEEGIHAENYAGSVSVNNSGNPRYLEHLTRVQLLDAEARDNAAYSASIFRQMSCLVASYDPKQDTATVRQLFFFDRTTKAEHKRKLGLIVREIHVLNASTSRRCIDVLTVLDKAMGYACRLSEADHADLPGNSPGKNPAMDLKRLLVRDRLNFQNRLHRDPEDMEFAPYAANPEKIYKIPDNNILPWPSEPANYARILTGSPVIGVFPTRDNSIVVLYFED